MPISRPTFLRGAALCGAVVVLGNLVGALALGAIPQAYKPGRLAEWLDAMLAAPGGATASAVLFTAGVLALVPLAAVLARDFLAPPGIQPAAGRPGEPRAAGMFGAVLLAVAGLMNASATLAPFVVIHHLAPAAGGAADPAVRAAAFGLLGWTLMMDALFNALLGLALVLLGWAMWRTPAYGRWLGGFGLVAGAATLPVMLQSVSYAAAQWLAVAGPLWLLWFAWLSVRLWRRAGAAAVNPAR